MKRNLPFSRRLLCSVIACTGFTGMASAEEEAAAFTIEEVVVTARKRAESLEDVPVAVSAYTEGMIEDAGIERPGDFLALTPNVTFVESESAGTSFLTVRGVSQVRNGESPVAVVIDGVLMTDPGQFNQELFDIQQIEVLKGPQGALYGRNAIGGAINITTKQAATEPEAKLTLGAGNGNRLKGNFSMSAPIIEDELYLRLAGSYVEQDGHIDNEFLNKEVDFYEDKSLRARLTWEPSDELSVDVRYGYAETEGGALNFVVNSGDADDTRVPIRANRLGTNERELENASIKIDYELGFATLTSITSWNSQEEFYAADAYPYECTPVCPLTAENAPVNHFFDSAFGFVLDQVVSVFTDIETVSQELRLTSSSENDLRWIAGVYFLETERFRGLPTENDLGQAYNRDVFDSYTVSGAADDNDNTAWAAFGQMNYDVSDQWEVSFALRYDKDEREQQDVAPAAFSSTSGLTRNEEYSELQPKFTLKYQPNDDFNAFFVMSKGFRSGGFNQNGVAALAASVGIEGISDDYEKEVSHNVELGFKSTWMDGRMKLNGSLFRTDIEDQHFFQFIGAINRQLLNNIDEVTLQGLEFDARYLATESLDLYLGFGVTDSEIEDYTVTPGDEGNWAPYVAKTTLNLGGQYNFTVSDGIDGFARLDFERRGQQYWDTANSSARSPIELINLRVGLSSEEHAWSVTAWAKNLTDEEYNAEYVNGGFAVIAPPRTYGLDVTKRF
jgi:iron complex outermembrane receptor protein